MPVPFGFSVGDFISGIEFLIDAIKSLRDTNGAQDYQKELGRELKHLDMDSNVSKLCPQTLLSRDNSQLLRLRFMTVSCALMPSSGETPRFQF